MRFVSRLSYLSVGVWLCFTLVTCSDSSSIATLFDSPEIQMVKGGHLSQYPGKTIGEAIDGFFGAPAWESGTGSDGATKGKTLVNATRKITYMEKEITAAMQFVVNVEAGTFELSALEFNGIPQNALIRGVLIKKMFE